MSRVFREIVRIRTAIYDRGYRSARSLGHPVISVGNLTTGGTGKTPLVMALATRLSDLNHRPVILSRGYRRQSRGVVVVGRGQGPEVGWREAGDEPYMMAARLPGVAVVVGADRFEAGRRAEEEGLGDVFILDDGFQHRRLRRQVDLVAVDPDDWDRPERLLPTGHWREPRTALARADAACVRAREGAEVQDLGVPVFRFTTEVDGILRRGEILDTASFGDRPVVAFAGIARPDRFFRTLRRMGLNVVATRSFRDHHAYSQTDLEALPRGVRITTEKDAVRLGDPDCCFLRISANILNFEELIGLIESKTGLGGRSQSRDHEPGSHRRPGAELGR